MKPPAFQFYADDFLAGVADMTQAEVGAYILLLCAQWSRGAVPTDPTRAALIAKGDVSAHVMAKFPDGMNPRMEQVRQKQADYRAKQADNGRKGMAKRWHNGAYNEPIASLQPKHNSPSPSPSPIKEDGNGADAPASKFKRPTLDDLFMQSDKVGLPRNEAERFFNYYESNGWKVGRNPMRSVPHALANWRMKWEETRNGSTHKGNAEKRVDRSIGTANEGIAHEYEGLGNMA